MTLSLTVWKDLKKKNVCPGERLSEVRPSDHLLKRLMQAKSNQVPFAKGSRTNPTQIYIVMVLKQKVGIITLWE